MIIAAASAGCVHASDLLDDAFISRRLLFDKQRLAERALGNRVQELQKFNNFMVISEVSASFSVSDQAAS